MAILIFLLPLLQAAAAGITIWGFCNTPATAEVAVTYGAFGADGPTSGEWLNSLGSILVGASGLVWTWFMQKRMGVRSELFVAVTGFLAAPTNPVSLFRLSLALVSIWEAVWVKSQTDREAVTFIKSWISEKILEQPTVIPVPNIKAPPVLTAKDFEQARAILAMAPPATVVKYDPTTNNMTIQ